MGRYGTTPEAHPHHPGEWVQCPDCGAWTEIEYENYSWDVVETDEQCSWCSIVFPTENPLGDLKPDRTPKRYA